MKKSMPRRSLLGTLGAAIAGVYAFTASKSMKGVVQHALASTPARKDYDPAKHKWVIALDINKCIGCGNCVEACKKENNVPRGRSFFRTWIERYIIKKPEGGSTQARGEVIVESPNGGINGFSPVPVQRDQIQHAFFVPKLCNLCKHSPCTQVCPVGATFDSPDGAVLIDAKYCIGCGFCIQACPYGCRYFNPSTQTADKCSLCYHRITRDRRPACVEICPSGARIFGDLKNAKPDDPIRKFFSENKVQALKGHLGTEPQVLYAGLDKEVR